MKKHLLTLFLTLFAVGLFAQQLSFRFANPRIIRVSGFDNIEYDIQIKCSVAGTYYFSGSYIFVFDNNALTQNATQWIVTKAPLITGDNTGGNPKYTVTKTVTGTAPNKRFNVALTCDAGIISNGPNADDFSEIPTDWTTIFTARGRITSTALNAGIDFWESSMNGQQSYSTVASPYYANYVSPNIYDSRDLVNAALGRLYSDNWGWSQSGNTVNAQWVNWNNAVNTTIWEGGASITQTDNTAALCNNLRLENGASLVVSANKWLTVNGNLTNTGTAANLTVASGGSLITNGTITGEGTLASNISPNVWHLISPPVPGLTANLFFDKYLQTYNEATNTWSDIIDPATPLMVGKGYAAWADPLNYTGVFNTGDIGPLAATKAGLGYNSIGNPYPSGLNVTAVNTWGANLSAFNWVWDQAFGNYRTTILVVPPAQGFFVQASNATTVTIPNAARAHTSQGLYKNSPVNQVSLNVAGNGYRDEAFVRFDAASSSAFDFGMDAPKIDGILEAPQMYSVIASTEFPNLTWNTLPQIAGNEIVNLNFKVGVEGTYTITASDLESFVDDVAVTLVDLKNNFSQKLNDNPVYSFTATPGDASARFLLVFSGATGIDNPAFAGVNIYAYDRNIMVNMPAGIQGDITVYDMVGKELYRTPSHTGLNSIPFHRASAWYVVKVSNEKGNISGKVFIR